MRKFFVFALLLTSLFFTHYSCAPLQFNQSEKKLYDVNFRSLSSIPESLEYFLHADRFHYYLKEFTHFFSGKVDEEIIRALHSITPQDVIEEGFTLTKLKSAQNYDLMIHKLLAKKAPGLSFSKQNLRWNYNFLKNKLDEAYVLTDPRFNADGSSALAGQDLEFEKFAPEKLDAQMMTLDSDHYISNRTTRAVFWEAAETGRTVEFHIGDQRDFLKHLTQNQGEILAEVRPMARNYNKIFLVQYPGEDTPRISITNVGGIDRLEHLGYHLNLTNFNNVKLTNQFRIYGSIDAFQERMRNRLVTRFNLMPKADRVIIGQKGAIESLFSSLWRYQALQMLLEHAPKKFNSGSAEVEKVKLLMADTNVTSEKMIAHSSAIDKVFEQNKEYILANPELIPSEFKVGGFSTSLADISDIAFSNADGKDVRWRVVSNMWGDEIVPIAQALKETGQKHVTYIGTTGAFPEKGYQVGDLVIPDRVQKDGKYYAFKGQSLSIERAKKAGLVQHVGSPFEETQSWLKTFQKGSDFVEIETSYLAKIFNGPQDHIRAYLLVSDILGKEGETLATATSSKRKASLNALLAKILDRDKAALPRPVDINSGASKLEQIRQAVQSSLAKKSVTYRSYAVANFLKEGIVPDVGDIQAFERQNVVFTDAYLNTRILQASEATSFLVREMSDEHAVPTIELPRELVDGTWNPKDEKIKIKFYGKTKKTVDGYRSVIEKNSEVLKKYNAFFDYEVVQGAPSVDAPHFRPSPVADSDVLLDIFSKGTLNRTGMDYSVGINGNVSYSFIPTQKTQDLCSPSHCQLAFFAPDNKTAEFMEQIKTIPGLNARKVLDRVIDEFNTKWFKRSGYSMFDVSAKAKIEEVDTLPNGRLAEIVPEYSATEGLVVKVRLTKAGKNQVPVLLEEAAHISQMLPDGFFNNPLYWAEVSLNAQYGSKRSELVLAQAELDAVNVVRFYFAQSPDSAAKASEIDGFLTSRKVHAEKIISEIKSEVKEENKARKAIDARWKDLQNSLESQKVKFDEYISANNRVKVRELISAYMPWAEMEPTEISAWTRWLDAIESPSKKAVDTEVLFRGIEGDLVRRSNDGGYFFMSTMLTKNQGNYTRRLRSLKTYDKKLGEPASDFPSHIRSLARAMHGHSHDPVGSPWLSAAHLSVAENFSSSGGYGSSNAADLVAIKIDKRRLISNYASDYGEYEKMIPLIIFPDEILAVRADSTENFQFLNEVESALGRKLTTQERGGVDKKLFVKETTKQWWDAIHPQGIKPTNVGPTCKQMMERFLQHAIP